MAARGGNPFSQRTVQPAQGSLTTQESTSVQVSASSRKRKPRPDALSDDSVDEGQVRTRQCGRRMPHFVHPYKSARDIVDEEYLARQRLRELDAEEAENDEDEPTEQEINDMSSDEREALAAEWERQQHEKKLARRPAERAHDTYEALRKIVGPAVLDEKQHTPGSDSTNDFYAELDQGACDARCHDTAKMTPIVGALVNALVTDDDEKVSEQPGAANRSERGLQHNITGYLMSCIQKDFSNPETKDAMRQGKEDWAETCFVRVLYPQDGYDVDAVRKNFTQSPQMVAAFKTLFCSPTEARAYITADENGPSPRKRRKVDVRGGPKRKSLAAKMSMEKVEPRCIAYTACQLHFALTDAKDWTTVYDGFNYAFFYDFIVDFFEGPQKTKSRRQNVEDILDWWNEQIFPRGHCRARRGGDMISKSAALLDEQD
ncbi:uncharacterized protein SCHCODRAFT_02687738 [Schizophyllum commune H4-8]|uniref:Expressed protein n=1 Tax=Schizophyllum commune (strain H4-8 / FGSC 9210) TaxID=578458 RepID=D8PQX7_SCHCM|nr:uncharacterized protein SCHCODRAFT_02687738 [Schizophyllum commune H4-8]KAI5893688.1 hypothetical protein SCHCODRAFT_02687738 [Schizophyllum commune H4-8]